MYVIKQGTKTLAIGEYNGFKENPENEFRFFSRKSAENFINEANLKDCTIELIDFLTHSAELEWLYELGFSGLVNPTLVYLNDAEEFSYSLRAVRIEKTNTYKIHALIKLNDKMLKLSPPHDMLLSEFRTVVEKIAKNG